MIVSYFSYTYSLEDYLDLDKLAPNGEVSGSLIFEVPKGDSNLKLKYKPSFWSSKNIIIKL